MTDNRKALGDSSPPQVTEDEFFACEPAPYVDPYKNRLPGPHPCDRSLDESPDINYSGTPNPAICSNRPIADMEPNLGSGDIHEGTAFRVPIGEPGFQDPDYN